MMTYKEMAENVLEARDRYEEKKRRRGIVMRRCIPAVTGLCAAIVAVVVMLRMPSDKIPDKPDIIIAETTSVTSYTEETTALSSADVTSSVTVPDVTTSAKTTPAEKKDTVTTTAETSSTDGKTSSNEKESRPAGKTTTTAAKTTSVSKKTTTSAPQKATTTAPKQTTTVPIVTTIPTFTTGSSQVVPGGGEPPPGIGGGGGPVDTGGTAGERPDRFYTFGNMDDRRYCAYDLSLPYDMTGSCIGSIELEAYDPEKGEMCFMTASVYSIIGYSPQQIIAVHFPESGGYYLYTELYCDAATLDSFITDYDRH